MDAIHDVWTCQAECQKNSDCTFWSLTKGENKCYLLMSDKPPNNGNCRHVWCQRGPRECSGKSKRPAVEVNESSTIKF